MRNLARTDLEQALTALGANLEARGLRFDVVLVGGANLLLRGVIDRPTKDGDLLGQRLESGDVAAMRELPPDRRAPSPTSRSRTASPPTGSTPAPSRSSTSACLRDSRRGSRAARSAGLASGRPGSTT